MRGPTCVFWANLTPFSLKVDPLRHRSGMYLRWDPEEKDTAAQAESAWRTVLAKFDALPMLSAG